MTTLHAALDLHRALAHHLLADVERHPVRPYTSPERAAELLNARPSREGLTFEQLATQLRTLLELTPATGSPRFFNQLFGGSDPAAVLGDMLAPLLNNSMYTWKVAGPHVLIENALIDHMAEFAGFSHGGGVFTPGGSLSNMTAMLIARNEALPTCREAGLTGATPRVYSSEEAHYSIRKAAGMIGVGRANVVSIAVDDSGRMRPDALRRAIAEDRRAGLTPIMVNATAGTTVQGAFDPIGAIADVAAEESVWLHVDGAYGGTMLLSDTTRHLLDGVARADSFTWDAHKVMGVPLTCSVLLTRSSDVLARNLNESATYLYQGDEDVFNPGTRSIQCGRRNDALKLWTAWQHHGDNGYAARVEHLMELAQYAATTIRGDRLLSLVHEPQSLNVCFVAHGVPSADICAELHREGLVMVGTGDVAGQRTIRLVCVDAGMTREDIDTFFAAVDKVASRLRGGPSQRVPKTPYKQV